MADILTATDPLFTVVLALWLIRSEAVDRTRFTGLIIGLAGVVALPGIDFHGRPTELPGAGAVLLGALGYSAAALLCRRWLADVPALDRSVHAFRGTPESREDHLAAEAVGRAHGHRVAPPRGGAGGRPQLVVLDCKGGGDSRRVADRARPAPRPPDRCLAPGHRRATPGHRRRTPRHRRGPPAHRHPADLPDPPRPAPHLSYQSTSIAALCRNSRSACEFGDHFFGEQVDAGTVIGRVSEVADRVTETEVAGPRKPLGDLLGGADQPLGLELRQLRL